MVCLCTYVNTRSVSQLFAIYIDCTVPKSCVGAYVCLHKMYATHAHRKSIYNAACESKIYWLLGGGYLHLAISAMACTDLRESTRTGTKTRRGYTCIKEQNTATTGAVMLMKMTGKNNGR